MVQELLVSQVPGRLGVAGHKLANVGARRNAHPGGRPGWPQLCSALRCTPPVYRSMRSAQVEVRWLRLPLQAGKKVVS